MIKTNTTNKQTTTMTTYKQVLVYTGYAAFGIERVDEIRASSLEGATKIAEDQLLQVLLEEDDDEIDEEFFGNGRVEFGIGVVDAGEENVIVVIDESHPLFHRVDDYENWSEEEFDEWVQFMDGF
jgi:hypothetical protein